MNRIPSTRRDERGIALVVAMLALLTVTMIVMVLMSTLNVETKIAGYSLRDAEARNNAEAGIAEAVARIRNGDIPDSGNPRDVAQIFLCNPGSVPSPGTDTLALATGQPAGQWLNYSRATRGPGVVTINYKADADQSLIYRYDKALTPPVNTTTGSPIWVITSTGHCGNVDRTIQAELFADPIVLNTNAAVSTNIEMKVDGSAMICGYDHASNTPVNTGVNGRTKNPDCIPYENSIQDLPGVRSTGDIKVNAPNRTDGVPSGQQPFQAGFYSGPWDVVGKSQAQFYQWMGPATSTPPNPANGLVHLDNDGIHQNKSGSFSYNGGSGEGLMYVDGSLTLNSTFVYKGLIYVEGDVTVNGQTWILGSLIVNGSANGKLNGGMTLLYSSTGIQDAIRKAGGQYVNLSWREVRYDTQSNLVPN